MVLNRRNCSLVGKLRAAALAVVTVLEGAGACALSGRAAKSKNGRRKVLEPKLAIYEEYPLKAKTKIFRSLTHRTVNISFQSVQAKNSSFGRWSVLRIRQVYISEVKVVHSRDRNTGAGFINRRSFGDLLET
jgi:hypothetical protein